MKNEHTPRLLRDSYLKGVGFTPETKSSPVLFALGLVIGICIGVML